MKNYQIIVYRIIGAVVANIVAWVCAITIICTFTNVQMAFNEPVTEGYYDLLKENALNVAKTLDKNVLSDETLTADFYFDEDKLVVVVESMKAKLVANIPVLNYLPNVKNGTIKFQVTADFENIKYEETNKLKPAWFYMLIVIFIAVFIGLVVLELSEKCFRRLKSKKTK